MNSKTRLLISGLLFLQYFIWGGWIVTAGTYMLNTLHFDGMQVGVVYGASAIAAIFSPFVMGIIADRYLSTEKLLALLQFLGGILMIWASYIQSFTLFYIVIIAYFFVFTPSISLSNAMGFHHCVDREKDFAAMRVWGTIGWIVAGAIVSILGWEETALPLRMAGITSIVAGGYSFYLPYTPPLQQKDRSLKALLKKEGKTLFLNKSFLILITCVVLIRIPSAFYYSFLNSYLHDIGIDKPALKMTLGQITEILLMLSLPFMLAKFGVKKVMMVGFASWAIRYVGFSMGDLSSSWIVYTSIIVHGLCYNYASLTAQIYVDKTVPPYLRGTAQGFMMVLIMGIGVFIGSSFAGFIVDIYTYNGIRQWQYIWLYPAMVGFLAFIIFGLFFKEKKMPSPEKIKEAAKAAS